MTKEIPLTRAASDDFASLCQEVRTELVAARDEIAENRLAITTLTDVLRQLIAGRRSDREVLNLILEACTREGSTEIADAIRHIEAGVTVLVADMKAVREAVVPAPAMASPA